MSTLGMTHSVCETCRRLVPAKLRIVEGDVYFDKMCPEHGPSRGLVRREVEDYLRALRYVKPAWAPEAFAGNAAVRCTEGCGFCSRHEQHLCMPIVEITSRCDLACPICLVDAGRPWDISREEFATLLDRLLTAERQVDILNLSGGEPLVHPRLTELVDEALSRPGIVRVSISTNGLALLRRPELLDRLRQQNVVISLQVDGFHDAIYETLRGRPLVAEKLAILELLKRSGVTSSLVMTAAAGVNDDQFPAMLKLLFSEPHIVSLMIQPLSFAGRAAGAGFHLPASCDARVSPDEQRQPKRSHHAATRLTIPDVVRRMGEAGIDAVQAADFLPLPCSHPLCFSLAFYLMLDGGGTVSIRRLIDPSQWLDAVANRTVFGLDEDEHQRMKDMIYDLWSGPAGTAPDSEAVMHTLRGILDEMALRQFDPRHAFSVTERRIKSIFIHAFQDAQTFDLARVRRCCNAYPQPDGRLMPACVHNVLGRNQRRSSWNPSC